MTHVGLCRGHEGDSPSLIIFIIPGVMCNIWASCSFLTEGSGADNLRLLLGPHPLEAVVLGLRPCHAKAPLGFVRFPNRLVGGCQSRVVFFHRLPSLSDSGSQVKGAGRQGRAESNLLVTRSSRRRSSTCMDLLGEPVALEELAEVELGLGGGRTAARYSTRARRRRGSRRVCRRSAS